jgi:putative phosphoesterase
MDGYEVRQRLPEQLIIDAAGKKIGVVHGRGPGFKARQVASEVFGKKVDIVIFAHSHSPVNEQKDGILYFNPGSPTDTVFAPYKSFGVIEIDGDDVRAEIIKIED